MLGVIFKRCALRDPQPGAPQADHRQPARPRGLAVIAGGREGHDLRGAARPLGPGVLTRRRPVLHPASGHPDHVRGHAAGAGRSHLRPGGGHRRVPLQRLPVRARSLRARPRPGRAASVADRSGRGHGAVAQGRAHVRDERLPARHRRRPGGRTHRARQLVRAVGRRILDGPRQSALRQEAEPVVRERGRRHRAGGPGRRPRGLLDLDQQQAAQLRAAHLHPAED